MNLKEYNLPDFSIFVSEKDYDYFIWKPDKAYIVIGRSNIIEDSVNHEIALEDNIEIIQRKSGGEAVIITPKTIVAAAKIKDEKLRHPKEYFRIFNSNIIKALESLGVINLYLKGISDIAINDKKISGSSMYRQKNIVFYHSVLNVAEKAENISKYLKHPSKEPDYRKGRSHKDFVTSLQEEGYWFRYEEIVNALCFEFGVFSE